MLDSYFADFKQVGYFADLKQVDYFADTKMLSVILLTLNKIKKC